MRFPQPVSQCPPALVRARHPAIGAGRHRQLSTQPYAFVRELGADRVIVVQGP